MLDIGNVWLTVSDCFRSELDGIPSVGINYQAKIGAVQGALGAQISHRSEIRTLIIQFWLLSRQLGKNQSHRQR